MSIRIIIDRIIVFIALMVLIISVFNIQRAYNKYRQGSEAYKKIEKTYVTFNENDYKDISEESWYTDIDVDFSELAKLNDEIIGWIRFDDGSLSYPVLQTSDNEKYLNLGADLSENVDGAIFADALINNPFNESYTIVYGHNMKDGSMFGKLKKLYNDKTYLDANKEFTVYTKDCAIRYSIFALYTVSADNDVIYRVGFAESKEFLDLLNYMVDSSNIKTDYTPNEKDKVITLSTCSGKENRFIVNAVEIDRINN